MKGRLHIHLDAVGGIAGDMFVAALMDAFPDLHERVMADISAVLPAEAGYPRLVEGMSASIRALRFGIAGEQPGRGAQPHGHHSHHHDHHDHGHSESSSFAAMCARIRAVKLAEAVSERAIAILRLIAEVEAHIHQVSPEEVHFHEISGWDSLADVVAAASIATALKESTWSVSELPRGGGLVHTQHGMLPVPAPAAAALLQGFSLRDDGIAGERVTPTGAAILRHLVDRNRNMPPAGKLIATGTGAGTRDLKGMPNVLRALVFETGGETVADTVAVISFEVDDMTGEEIGIAADRLREQKGTIDVSLGLRVGKKSRPLHAFHLIADPAALESAIQAVFHETSTIGLRWRLEQRSILPREMHSVDVEGSTVRVKRVRLPDGQTTAKAESDDLADQDGLRARRALKRRAEKESPS
jgi:uncharacterized protein (TIGR00299 family) protein